MKLGRVIIDAFKNVVNALPVFSGISGSGETLTDVMTLQQDGFASFPAGESQGFMLTAGQLQLLLNAVDPAKIPEWSPGEKFFYFDPDNYVKWDPDGNLLVSTTEKVTITAAGEIKIDSAVKVVVEAPLVELGEATQKKLVNEGAALKYKVHTHPDPVSGSTGAPSNNIDNDLTDGTTAS